MGTSSPLLGLRILLGALASIVLLAACDSTHPIPPSLVTAIPTASADATGIAYRPSINITRANYEAAVNKWKAQGILEYEISTNEVSLRSENGYPETYRVNGDNITILSTIWDSHPTPSTINIADDPYANTVEGLFAHTDVALNDASTRISLGSQTVYDIQFDPTYGYVTSYYTVCEERTKPIPSISGRTDNYCPTDTYIRIKVSDFKVLRSRLLGTPTATH